MTITVSLLENILTDESYYKYNGMEQIGILGLDA
jgi:hypothetical protein